MRDIKFRAFHKDIGMFYQEDQYLPSYLRRLMDKFCVSHPKYLPCEIEDMIMLYTGLKDSTGREIYEGDILSCFNARGKRFLSWVQFNDGCFDIMSNDIFTEWSSKRDYLKCLTVNHAVTVIGNIHENPELLEAQK